MKIRYESLRIEQALAGEYAAETQACLSALRGLNDIRGLIESFEKDFARYIGTAQAVAVGSGSDALRLMLAAAGIGRGDEVIVPTLTYRAVPLAVLYSGARPVLVDSRSTDLTLDPECLTAAIGKRTRAVIAPHMFGCPCDISAISRICRDRKIFFLEDVCQAESSRWQGRRLGSFGDMAAFSFSYYKPLSSCGGGGGMVTFSDPAYNKISRWMKEQNDGADLVALGQRLAPMTLMDLIVLRVKFRRLSGITAGRREILGIYEKEFGGQTQLEILRPQEGAEVVPQNFVIRQDRRDELNGFLDRQGVMAQLPYTPVHRMAGMSDYGGRRKFPVSDDYWKRALQLPLFTLMTEREAKLIAGLVKIFNRNRAGT